MPLRSYMLGHPEARITDQERDVLIQWAKDRRAELGVASSDDAGDETEDEENEGQGH